LSAAKIADAISQSPAGPLKLISMCAGDGRDLLLALREHPRRNDVNATLLEIDLKLRHPRAADNRRSRLGRTPCVSFHVDASLAGNYEGIAMPTSSS